MTALENITIKSVLMILVSWLVAGPSNALAAGQHTEENVLPPQPAADQGPRTCENRWYRFFHPRPGEFKDVSVGFDHTCAIDSRGLLYCWGNGRTGQLGHSDCVGATSKRPIRASGLNRYTHVVSGRDFSCALNTHGQAYCWGDGSNGVLGDGNSEAHIVAYPQPVKGGVKFKEMTAGERHVCAVSTNDTHYCWGNNSHGQLLEDKETSTDRSVPTAVKSVYGIRALIGGGNTTCGITYLEGLACWGEQARYPEPTRSDTRIRVGSATVGTLHTCMVTQEKNEARCWGQGGRGRLGDGDISEHYTKRPRAVFAPNNYHQIASGKSHTCGIRFDRKAYCWGDNSKGQLGIGDKDVPATGQPSAVAFAGSFTKISANGDTTCAISSENELYCWGDRQSRTFDEHDDWSFSYRPKIVYSFPIDRADMDRYCQDLMDIDAITTKLKHPAVLGHNINKDGLNIKGCAFMSAIPKHFDDKESPELHELKRQMQGYITNFGSTGEYICHSDIMALTDRAIYIESKKKWAIRCDANLQKKPFFTKPFRLKPGQTAKLHSMSNFTKFLKAKEGVCAIIPDREKGFVCEPNACEDDKKRQYGPGEQYGEALAGKPRAIGTECMSIECVVDENSGRHSEKAIDISATWRWVKDDEGKFICRAINNGCYFEGKFFNEAQTRTKASEIHFSSKKNNTACSYKELSYTCEKKPSKVFDWTLKSVQTVEGSREGAECRPIKGCVHEGAKYNEGQTITDNGPIRFTSSEDVSLCSFSQSTKTCQKRFEGSYYWKTTSFQDKSGFKTGDSCVEYDGCFFAGRAYKIGEHRSHNGAPIFSSDSEGSVCRYELENYECSDQDGRRVWELKSKVNISGKKKGKECKQISACIDSVTGQVVELGQKFKKPILNIGKDFNGACSRINSTYTCQKKSGAFVLEFEGNETILERGWTFKPKNNQESSCEQHKNCANIVDGKHGKHSEVFELNPPIVDTYCTYYARKCEHGKEFDLTRNCKPQPHDDRDDD